MAKLQIDAMAPEMERELVGILTAQGRVAAMRFYKIRTGCRLKVARAMVDRIGREIEPGPAPTGAGAC